MKLAESSFTRDNWKLWNKAPTEVKEVPIIDTANKQSKQIAKCSQPEDKKEKMSKKRTEMETQTKYKYVIVDREQ